MSVVLCWLGLHQWERHEWRSTPGPLNVPFVEEGSAWDKCPRCGLTRP